MPVCLLFLQGTQESIHENMAVVRICMLAALYTIIVFLQCQLGRKERDPGASGACQGGTTNPEFTLPGFQGKRMQRIVTYNYLVGNVEIQTQVFQIQILWG